jgi:hypothetical protein
MLKVLMCNKIIRLSPPEKTLKTLISSLKKKKLSYTTKTSRDDKTAEEAFKE